MGYLVQDSPSYLEPAVYLVKGQIPQAVSLIRPIGYPAFLALLGLDFTYILYVQALVLSIIPVCTFFLVRVSTGYNRLGFGAGMVSAISPTGIAVGSMVASDALFAALFAVLFTTLVYGTLRNSLRWILISAIASGLAILVRPILLFWPVVSVTASALIAASQDGLRSWLQVYKGRLAQLLVLFLIPTVFMVSWAGANYAKNGLFTVSIMGDLTLREYLAVEAEEWGKAGHWPTLAAITQNRNILRERLNAMTLQEQARTFWPESIAIFEKYPSQTAISFVKNAVGNAVVSVISGLESGLRWIGLLMILVAPVIGLIAVRLNPSPYEGRIASILIAMTLTFVCYLALLGLTFWTGLRIIYAVEILQISTAAMLVAVLARAIGRLGGWHRVDVKAEKTAEPS